MTQPNIFVVPSGREGDDPRIEAVAAPTQFADFERIQPGDEVHFTKTVTPEDLEAFAKLSGDRNPLHMDDKFAGRTHFQRRVVHGMLIANYLSTLVGMKCPGPGALWTEQNLRWPAPVFIGDRVQVTLKVTHKSTGSRTLAIEAKATNQDGKVVMEGKGTVTVLEERQQTREIPITERVAFVSGGARGIGAAIASSLAQAGAMVVVGYRTSAAVAGELCASIQSSGGRAISLQADITDQVSVRDAIEKAQKEFDRPVSILINNAGSLPEPRPFMQTTWEEVQSKLDVHIRGAFHCCQAVIPGMIEQKSGRIINIGSVFTHNMPSANWSSFLLAKAALQSLTRSLAAELGPQGIRVNTVSLGLVETESIAGLSERVRKVQAMQTPLRRLASPADVAAVVTALCTSAGDFVTGADIPVCGGFQA